MAFDEIVKSDKTNDDEWLSRYDRAELIALRELRDNSFGMQKTQKTKYQMAATASFALAGSALMLGGGLGFLGVLAIWGLSSGILCLVKASE